MPLFPYFQSRRQKKAPERVSCCAGDKFIVSLPCPALLFFCRQVTLSDRFVIPVSAIVYSVEGPLRSTMSPKSRKVKAFGFPLSCRERYRHLEINIRDGFCFAHVAPLSFCFVITFPGLRHNRTIRQNYRCNPLLKQSKESPRRMNPELRQFPLAPAKHRRDIASRHSRGLLIKKGRAFHFVAFLSSNCYAPVVMRNSALSYTFRRQGLF